MTDELVGFEVAKLAKERGYVNNACKQYNRIGTHIYESIQSIQIASDLGFVIPAPTQSLLKRWLREKHEIHIKVDDFIDSETGIEWDYEIVKIGTDLDEKGHYVPLVPYSMDDPCRKFKTYEQSLEKGLLTALKLIK